MSFGVPIRILAAAVLLSLALVGLVAREGMARASGQEVALPIQGYDPRSLLSGHYVAFQLQEVLPAGAACPPGTETLSFPPARQWVGLKRSGAWHTVAGVAKTKQEAQGLGDIAVRGYAQCFATSRPGEPAEPAPVSLHIGVDRFHVDQDQAEAMERALGAAMAPAAGARGGPPPTAFAVVSIGRDGKGRLKAMIINGRRTDLTWF